MQRNSNVLCRDWKKERASGATKGRIRLDAGAARRHHDERKGDPRWNNIQNPPQFRLVLSSAQRGKKVRGVFDMGSQPVAHGNAFHLFLEMEEERSVNF